MRGTWTDSRRSMGVGRGSGAKGLLLPLLLLLLLLRVLLLVAVLFRLLLRLVLPRSVFPLLGRRLLLHQGRRGRPAGRARVNTSISVRIHTLPRGASAAAQKQRD